MAKPLVIVESPAKAKTISRFLGSEYVVESSIGHVRDLPNDASDIPAAYKGQPWTRLGVDVENDFKPLYVVSREKKSQVSKLKGLLKEASELYLATDEDREGEAIAWHLLEVLKPKIPVKRMVFHEITKQAIAHAVENWRELNQSLVDAQEGRRILDRLVGYELSPVLWRKVKQGLSAGRVQSVATRILVQREKDRVAFVSASYWDLTARFDEVNNQHVMVFSSTLVEVDGKRLATGKDFNDAGKLKKSDMLLLDEKSAVSLVQGLEGAEFSVLSREEKPYKRTPYPPFMTSTLQQEAGRKLRFSSRRAMQAAQRLYEQGFITYMRTDSTTLSNQALDAARSQARALYGDAFVPDAPRRYEKKVKNAQEAHEAIRPAGETFRTPSDVAKQLGPSTDEAKLYELIWKRTIASQMADARGMSLSVRIGATANTGEKTIFAASGKTIEFAGFLRAYVEGADDPDAQLDDREVRLPELREGDRLTLDDVDADGHAGLLAKSHETQPPARYTEASLVKRLEELGVGRPSTYASIINTIQNRGYCWKKGTALVPTYVAFAVVQLLEDHFTKLVDYGFTAQMENELDEIAAGSAETVPWLKQFYFGDEGLKNLVGNDRIGEIDPRALNTFVLGQDPEGNEITIRVRWGSAVVARGEEMAAVPEGTTPDEVTVEKALELLKTGQERQLGADPETGEAIVVKTGRFGPYVQAALPEEDAKKKPRTASLLKSMSPQTVTLEEALRLLSLPRTLGADPETGDEITVQNGRYGPYAKRGAESRSLESEEQLFVLTLDEAVALFKEPKRRRGQTATGPLRELGIDPATEKPIVVKDGRYGPYCTDGETNASVPRGETAESLTFERAVELLAERRAAGPKKKRSTKSTKKPAAKKATKPKATEKKTAEKKPPAKGTKKDASKKSSSTTATTKSKITKPTRTTKSADTKSDS